MPPTSAAGAPPGAVARLAAWTTMPWVSVLRSVGTAFGVGTRSRRARSASTGEIAASSSLVKMSMPADGDSPDKADLMIGQSLFGCPLNAGDAARTFPSASIK
jgi:hypothetical protein